MVCVSTPVLGAAIVGAISLAVLPTAKLGDVLYVWLSRKLGVKPKQIEQYDNASEDN